MVSAMVCQAIGRGFKSRHSRILNSFGIIHLGFPKFEFKEISLFTKNLMGLSLALLERVQAV